MEETTELRPATVFRWQTVMKNDENAKMIEYDGFYSVECSARICALTCDLDRHSSSEGRFYIPAEWLIMFTSSFIK